MSEPIPELKTVLGRGLRRRCPRCGQGAVFDGWIKLHKTCPACGLKYLHNEGDLWAYLVAVDRALFIFPLIVIIYFRLYNPYSIWFYIFTVTVVLVFVGTLPQRNGMALGADYWMRLKYGDLSETESSEPGKGP